MSRKATRTVHLPAVGKARAKTLAVMVARSESADLY